MAILRVEDLSKSFGILELFSGLSFSINRGQKVGLIAPNGTGKSTLLNILVGAEPADSGIIQIEKGARVAYLSQKSDFSSYPEILSACMSEIRPDLRSVIQRYEAAISSGNPDEITHAIADMDAHQAWDVEQNLTALLTQLNLNDLSRSPQGLSGGETKRIALAATLLGSPDLIILDEPTNHLDPDIIEWLEEYLSTTQLSLLMVTHDRYFLDKVCDTIFELDCGVLFTYEGNYSKYLERRQERMEQLESEQQSLRNIHRKELEWMRRQPQARGTKAKYRIEAFHELEGKIGAISKPQGPKIEAEKVYIGKKIFEAKNLAKSFGDKVVISDFTYNFARRDKIGVIGANGSGKTTLVKLLMGELESTTGSIEIGETVQFGYFSQQPFQFKKGKKVIEVVTDIADEVMKKGGKPQSALQLLTRFLFPPKRQQDYVENLSGGELRRLQLCTVLMQSPNFLVLDEPTNDLDIPTLQVLEEYLHNFDGCLLIVSHDRYFMDRLTEHLFVLEGDGLVRDFPGNFTDYRMSQKAKQKHDKVEASKKSKETLRPIRERKSRRTYKEEQEFQAITKELPELEEQLEWLERQMSTGTLSPEELVEASEKYEQAKSELDEKELRWLELSEIGE